MAATEASATCATTIDAAAAPTADVASAAPAASATPVASAAPATPVAPAVPLKIGVLVSGGGTNLQAILNAIANDGLPVQVAAVVSSRPDAYGIERARAVGIEPLIMSRADYADTAAADQRIADFLKDAGCEYVVMAGYMRMVTPVLLGAFPDRVLNLHPALLPSFKGAHGIQDAFNAGVKVTGVTVHLANEEYDKGPIVAQRAVEVREGETVDELEARIHAAEYEIYPEVLRAIAEGRMSMDEDRKVHIAPRA